MKIALVIASGFLFVGFVVVDAARGPQSFEAAAYYKKNCEECHGAAAEKRFNPDSPDSQMIDSILNGAKAEGSRDMPAYSEKGIDEPKAKALITFMKSIRE